MAFTASLRDAIGNCQLKPPIGMQQLRLAGKGAQETHRERQRVVFRYLYQESDPKGPKQISPGESKAVTAT